MNLREERTETGPATRHQAYTGVREDIVNLVPLNAMNVLDVGCSNGALGLGLLRLRLERRVSGIEINPQYALEAESVLNRVICANLEQLDWASTWRGEKFDCIIFADVLEHLSNPSRCLGDAISHLAPTGCIIVSLPNIRHISAFKAIFLEGSFPRKSRGIFDDTHLRWFTISDGLKLMQSQGLLVKKLEPALRIGDQGGGWINRRLNKLPLRIKSWWVLREFFGYQISYQAWKESDEPKRT